MKATADHREAMTRKLGVQAAMFFPREKKSRYGFIDAGLGKAAQSLLSKGFMSRLLLRMRYGCSNLRNSGPSSKPSQSLRSEWCAGIDLPARCRMRRHAAPF
jgi:hypothetical protein